jgi:succinylarginine dihydrolase
MSAYEVNFDGLVGPTHNYAGLSYGNLASQKHRNTVSNPRRAALQGLEKMKFLSDLGVKQAVLPPQERPDLRTLRRLGFGGTDAQVLEAAHRDAPAILASCFSASAMWAANAATVSPSADSADGRVHFTPANLVSQFHRSLEAQTTSRILHAIFNDERFFAHHPPLPAGVHFADEGAANHMRLAASHAERGVEIFVYGRSTFDLSQSLPSRYPARQTLEASQSIARLHRLDSQGTVFIRQNPAAIDAGAFHNDVVAVANENVLLYHAAAFADSPAGIEEIRQKFPTGIEPVFIEVSESEVSLADAVSSYLFNSQLVRIADGSMAIICPIECRENESTRRFLVHLMAGRSPIRVVHFVDVRQSMNNGGGPACLRLRVVLNEQELGAMRPTVLFTDTLYDALRDWVQRRYRERFAPDDLADPNLVDESRIALDELTQILGMGSLYDFQKD